MFSLFELKNKSLNQYYFAYYKPKGMEVSLKGNFPREFRIQDNLRGAKILQNFIHEIGIYSVKPVGRLDLDSEGLLLLSKQIIT